MDSLFVQVARFFGEFSSNELSRFLSIIMKTKAYNSSFKKAHCADICVIYSGGHDSLGSNGSTGSLALCWHKSLKTHINVFHLY